MTLRRQFIGVAGYERECDITRRDRAAGMVASLLCEGSVRYGFVSAASGHPATSVGLTVDRQPCLVCIHFCLNTKRVWEVGLPASSNCGFFHPHSQSLRLLGCCAYALAAPQHPTVRAALPV